MDDTSSVCLGVWHGYDVNSVQVFVWVDDTSSVCLGVWHDYDVNSALRCLSG